MEYRYLGPTGIKISVLSLGTWLNSHTQQAKKNTIQCVKKAWDMGVNFFDTAQGYGNGEAEIQLGQALKQLNIPRHKYVLSTKIFWGSKQDIPNRRGLSRKHVIQGVKACLKRLDHGYADVVFCHRPHPQTPVQQTCRAFDWLIRKGLTFYWGTSQWSAQQILEAHFVCSKYCLIKPIVQQPQYSILVRQKMQIGYQKIFKKGLMGTTVWSPLVGGVLTGKYNNGIPQGSRFATNPDVKYVYDRYFGTQQKKAKTIQSLKKFKQLADQLKISISQLALAWTIKNPDVSTAITGASSPKQLQQTLKSAEYIKLITPQIQQRIQEIFDTAPKGKKNMKTFEMKKSRRVKCWQQKLASNKK